LTVKTHGENQKLVSQLFLHNTISNPFSLIKEAAGKQNRLQSSTILQSYIKWQRYQLPEVQVEDSAVTNVQGQRGTNSYVIAISRTYWI